MPETAVAPTALALLVWTIAIAVRAGRTPLEAIMPDLDRQLVSWLRTKLAKVFLFDQGTPVHDIARPDRRH